MTIEEVAIAITANPAWSGDTGLFPDYLPNAQFAEAFLTQLLSEEVTADYLEAAIVEMTASLNAGDSRGATINAAIDALAATDSADEDLGNAAAALANKTEVATYYSVEQMQSSADLDDLMAVVMDVTSDEDAVADGETAVDDAIAAETPLLSNLADLADAQAAVDAFLLAAGQTEATEAADPPTDVPTLTATYGAALIATDGEVAGAYAAATPTVQAALLAAQQAVNDAARDDLQDDVDDANDEIDDVTGLAAAAAAATSAADAAAAAAVGNALNDIQLIAAVANYDLQLTANVGVVTASGAGIVTAVADAGAAALIQTNTGGSLELVFGITETTNPGVTALLAAYVSNNAAQSAVNTANATSAVLTQAAASLDLGDQANTATALANLTAGFTIGTPAAATASNAEVVAEVAALTAAEDAGQEALSDDIGDIAFDTDNATTQGLLTALTAAAGAFITGAEATAINNAFAAVTVSDQATTDLAIAGAQAVLGVAVNAGGALELFTDLIAAYDAEELGDTPLIDDLDDAETALDTHVTTVDEPLAEAVADEVAAGTAVLTITGLNLALAAAEAALAEQDVSVSTIVAEQDATDDNDAYLLGTAGGTIDGFGDDGDDVIYIGEDAYVINIGDVDEGDDTVLEVFLDESAGGDTTLSIETSVFGGSAAEPEVIVVVLTGVAAADISIDTDGFIVA